MWTLNGISLKNIHSFVELSGKIEGNRRKRKRKGTKRNKNIKILGEKMKVKKRMKSHTQTQYSTEED